MNKDLKEKAINIKGKNYVQVKDRILYLSENYKDKYKINTSYDYYPERKLWVVKATLEIGECTYTGLAQEIESDNYKDVNFASALENCETSAVGRACAMAGIGVIDSLASVDEMNKHNNRVKKYSEPTKENLKNFIFVGLDYNNIKDRETLKKIKGSKWIAKKKVWGVPDTEGNRTVLSELKLLGDAINYKGEIIKL